MSTSILELQQGFEVTVVERFSNCSLDPYNSTEVKETRRSLRECILLYPLDETKNY